jgi:hypothetical protein
LDSDEEMFVKIETRNSITGKVASRECPLCGHHEIGFVTENGEFHPLRPGTPIRLEAPVPPAATYRDSEETPFQKAEEPSRSKVWIPEPIRGDTRLRRKYGVMIKGDLIKDGMSVALYELAYVEKIERLIEKAVDIPLPVTLDRFFSAPHLASGSPRQIAEGMVRELDEIRRPGVLVTKWLDTKDDQSLSALVAPRSMGDLGRERAEDAQIKRELETLSLEEFLEML